MVVFRSELPIGDNRVIYVTYSFTMWPNAPFQDQNRSRRQYVEVTCRYDTTSSIFGWFGIQKPLEGLWHRSGSFIPNVDRNREDIPVPDHGGRDAIFYHARDQISHVILPELNRRGLPFPIDSPRVEDFDFPGSNPLAEFTLSFA